MPEAWYMDDDTTDCRAPHRLQPNQPVGVEELLQLGVLCRKINIDGDLSDLRALQAERGYSNSDEITCSKAGLGDCYEEKLKTFYAEHIHEDEEIRLVLDGCGYFDVRDKRDRWIRIAVRRGDLLILPAGIYHRFTLDETDYIQAKRLFKEAPKWIPINRPCEENTYRVEYLASIAASA